MPLPSQTASGLAGAGISSKMSPRVTRFGLRLGTSTPTRLLAGDRRQDPDLGRRERVGEVVAQLRDLAHLDPGGELELVAGHARAGDRADRGRLDPEAREAAQQRLGDAAVRLAARARLRVGLRSSARSGSR